MQGNIELGNKLLAESTIEDVQQYAAAIGFNFSGWDCEDVFNTAAWYNGDETVAEAIEDYIDAYGA